MRCLIIATRSGTRRTIRPHRRGLKPRGGKADPSPLAASPPRAAPAVRRQIGGERRPDMRSTARWADRVRAPERKTGK